MKGCEDGWDIRPKAVAQVEACYFEDTKSPIRADRGGSLNINKNEGYDLIFRGCNNLVEGYTNLDGAKISKSFSVVKTDWKPTNITSTYTVNQLDKTVDVPALCEKYSGAGKVEIYKAYTDEVPAVDEAEFNRAAQNYATAPAYTADSFCSTRRGRNDVTSSCTATAPVFHGRAVNGFLRSRRGVNRRASCIHTCRSSLRG